MRIPSSVVAFLLSGSAIAHAQSTRDEGWRAARELVLEGALVTMTERGVLSGARLRIGGGRIQRIFEAAASDDTEVLRTAAWIFPGFINLHTHLPFNHQPLWVAERKFENRYQWQVYPPHVRAVMMPAWILLGPREYNLLDEQTLFSEVRALVGGTTALLATHRPGSYAEPARLVRNIEREPPLSGRVEAHVAELDDAFVEEHAPLLRAALEGGELRAWVAHVAEGRDDRSREELERLKRAGLLREEVVIVHGTGLDRAQLGQLGAVGGHLVWAPTSNLLLYGEMADVEAAIEAGVTVSLSNDWAPSGTHNLLAELKVAAAAFEQRFGTRLSARTLVEMITVNPARAIGWQDRAGVLRQGAQADLVVVARRSDDPYEDLVRATEEDIELVLVGGEPLFGRVDWMERFKPNDSEILSAKGRSGEPYFKRIDVTQTPGARNLAQTRARLRAALRFEENDMLDAFLDSEGRAMTAEVLARHLEENYRGLEPQPLARLFLANDEEFFERLREMKFPFTDALEEAYR